MRLLCASALAATCFAFSLAPTLATGAIAPQVRQAQQTEPQVRQTETTLDTPNTPNGPNAKAPTPMPASSPMLVPVTSANTSQNDSGCTPTTSLLQFDGGYEVSMCYRTPDTPDGTEGVTGQAKAGLYASAESGLLWFFSRDNAEVLVKVLNGCAINGYRWVFVAPVTTLEFDLRVTSPTGARWNHTNTQGVTAATKSDVSAFACADEPDAAALNVSGVSGSLGSPGSQANPVAGHNVASGLTALNVPGVLDRGDGDAPAAAPNGRAGSASSASAVSLRYRYSSASSPDEATDASDAFMAGTASDTAAAPTLAVGRHGPQTDTIPDTPDTRNGTAPTPMHSSVPMTATSSATSPDDSLCTPTTNLLRFDGGYEVSMCYRTPDTPDGTEGVEGQAKAGLYASAESGLLWFFSRDNAEVLVKVLNGCAINGYRWVFAAPVTTLEFDLQVTSPTGARWNHTNTQGVTAATKSDVAAFSCADEPDVAPDLIVSDVTVSDATPVAGQTITLRATVRNRGDGPATPTTLRFYRSDDSTISASDNSDVSFASEAVGALAVSAAESRTLDYTVPSTPGTFYVGACIDSVAAESRTGNNCSAGVRVVVEDEPEPAPDLVVSGVTVSDATPVAGQTITLRATVRNRGDGPATPTTLRFYQSSDSTVSASDIQLDSDPVAALSASAAVSLTFNFRVPPTPGTFYVGACIDSVAAESRTGNNCSTGVRVVVEEEPEPAPDLVVSGVTVSDAAPVAGQTITLRATVQNRGDGPATPTTLRFYRSSDSTISTSDVQLDSGPVAALSASAAVSLTFNFRVPSTSGTFYVGACIDSVAAESRTGNNCSTSVLVTVEEKQEPGPDLTVTKFTLNDAKPVPGSTFEAWATVLNDGDRRALDTGFRLHRSDDPTVSLEEPVVSPDFGTVRPLSASATQFVSTYATTSTPETFYVGGCIVPVAGESDTSNNCSDGVLVTVEELGPGPDLLVSGFTVNDRDPAPGQDIVLTATVRNRGDSPAAPTTLRYVRSDDPAIISTEDDEVGSEAVAELAASGTESVTFDYTVPSTPGRFWFGACIDSVSDEAHTGNNCSSAGHLGRVIVAPDLIVPGFTVSDENPAIGDVVQLQATVTNQGTVSAPTTTLRYYQSDNWVINTKDTEVGSQAVGALAVSGTESVTFDYTVPSPAGTFWLGACVDSVPHEFYIAENGFTPNCSSSVRVVLREPAPDLTVSGFTVADENPVAGAVVQLQATVTNQGDASAPTTTLRYVRSDDSTINAEDTEVGSGAVAELVASGTESLTYDYTVPSSASTFYLGACIDDVSDESDTGNNCSTAVLVTVE